MNPEDTATLGKIGRLALCGLAITVVLIILANSL